MPASRRARRATAGCGPWRLPQPGHRPLSCMQGKGTLLTTCMPCRPPLHAEHAGTRSSCLPTPPLARPTKLPIYTTNASLTTVQHMSEAWCASTPAGALGRCPPPTQGRCGGPLLPEPARMPMPAGAHQHHKCGSTGTSTGPQASSACKGSQADAGNGRRPHHQPPCLRDLGAPAGGLGSAAAKVEGKQPASLPQAPVATDVCCGKSHGRGGTFEGVRSSAQPGGVVAAVRCAM